MDTVVITCKVNEQTDIALRHAAAARRQTKSEVLREAILLYLTVNNGQTSIAEILTDFSDGRESFNGAVKRLTATIEESKK